MAVLHYPIEDEDGKSVWPEKFDAKELEIRKKGLGPLRYAQEYLCSPIALFGSQLNLEWLTVYDYSRALEDQELKNADYFFGVDPSISGTGDYCVICVLAKTKERYLIVDFIREKAKLDRMVELIKRTAVVYKPIMINVEAIQAQALLVQTLVDKTDLPIRSYMPTGKKEDRINVMAQVYFSTQKAQIRGHRDESSATPLRDERMSAFVQEWLAFPRGRHDDTLDAVEAAIQAASSSGMAASLSSEAPDPKSKEPSREMMRRYFINRRRFGY